MIRARPRATAPRKEYAACEQIGAGVGGVELVHAGEYPLCLPDSDRGVVGLAGGLELLEERADFFSLRRSRRMPSRFFGLLAHEQDLGKLAVDAPSALPDQESLAQRGLRALEPSGGDGRVAAAAQQPDLLGLPHARGQQAGFLGLLAHAPDLALLAA